MNNSVSQALVRLFEEERFYAELICQMDRFEGKKVPIAGVCIKDRIELHINPDTFGKYPIEERTAILKHECEHILRDHISRMKDYDSSIYAKSTKEGTERIVEDIINSQKHKSLNIAADLAINGIIKNVPEGGMFPKNFDLPNGETFEWYIAQLKDNPKAKGAMEFDDHAIWQESTEGEEILKEKVRQAVEKAAQNTRNAGKMTAHDELLVSKFAKETVNWKAQLRRFVARSLETVLDTSKKKRNRRYGIMYPGTIKTEVLHIGVAIDTSGSVSDEALNQFMAEIHQIHKTGAVITVVEADSEIKNHYEYNPKKQYKVSGRGGTAYQPAFDFFNKEKGIDAMIYFGDMDCFDTEEIKKPKYPVLWAIVGDQKPPASFGSQLKVKVS